jgi:ribosomal protein L2
VQRSQRTFRAVTIDAARDRLREQGKKEEAAMRSKQEEALLRRARRLVDLGDQLKSIREEVEQIAFDIYDEVGQDRESRRALEGNDNEGGGVAND